MRSTTGAHYVGLDHVRALAAFLVFTWHFSHGAAGSPVPFQYTPSFFPLALWDEGHVGVALFMTLSGYLFAKLLDGKSVDFKAFLWNRALRLLPLLTVVLALVGVVRALRGQNMWDYAGLLVQGLVLPTLPSGGWSITVELHFYLLLPLFLWMVRKSRTLPLVLVGGAMLLRTALWAWTGEVQTAAYWTLIGRLDQFVLGMLAFHYRSAIAGKHLWMGLGMLGFMGLYWLFDRAGGFYLSPSYPSPSPVWILLPTLEGLAFAGAIAWYDNSFVHSNTGLSKFVGKLGEYSYSTYLLHFFFVFQASQYIHHHVMDLSSFGWACVWSLALFALMIVPGYLSYRFIESPFLRLRKRYTR